MEDRAPYGVALPDMLAPLAECLQLQGFVTNQQAQPDFCRLTAHWVSPRSDCFELRYTWQAGPVAEATCRLQVLAAGRDQQPETLFSAQRVRRLRDVARLLRGNVCYSNARLVATLPHPGL